MPKYQQFYDAQSTRLEAKNVMPTSKSHVQFFIYFENKKLILNEINYKRMDNTSLLYSKFILDSSSFLQRSPNAKTKKKKKKKKKKKIMNKKKKKKKKK